MTTLDLNHIGVYVLCLRQILEVEIYIKGKTVETVLITIMNNL